MDNETLIYVRVKIPHQMFWESVSAINLHSLCYWLLESSSDQEHWPWEFEQGEVVKCELYEFAPDELGLVALSKCDCAN